MRYLLLAAVAVTLATMSGHAEAAKKIHKSNKAYAAHGALQSDPNPFGNAAAGGNNANSMSGSNSAGDNANGRTNGGGGMH